jgi:hypothetical protein
MVMKKKKKREIAYCYFVLSPINAQFLTNYHTTKCFDTIMPSSDSLQTMSCQVTQVLSNAAVGNAVYS